MGVTLSRASPARPPVVEPAARRAPAVALLALATIVAESATGVLPDDALVGVVTAVRVVLLVGLCAVLIARPPGPGGGRPALDRTQAVLLAAVGALICIAAAATAHVGADYPAWRALVTTAAAGLLAAGARRVVDDIGPAAGLLALLAVGAAGLTAVHQSADGVPTGFCRGALDASADVCAGDALVRAVGTFTNPNLLAAFLVLLLPLAAAGSAALADRAGRLVGTAVVVVGYAAVVLTGSRGGIVAAVLGAVTFVALRKRSPRRLAAAALVATGGIAMLVAVTDDDVGVRSDVWRAAVHLLLTHPLGVGPGRAGPLLDAAIPGPEAFQHAHNLWLNQAVELGWAGLAAVSTITVCTGMLVARRPGSSLSTALGAGLAGFAVASLFDDPANTSRIALALAVVVGLAAGAPPACRSDATTTPVGSGHRHRRGRPTIASTDRNDHPLVIESR